MISAVKRVKNKILNSLLYSIGELLKTSENNHLLQFEKLLLLQGKQASRQLIEKIEKIKELSEAEFTVFSQTGEDGIIQFLINTIAIDNNTFVEFGVENYTEANTKFLLINDNWKGIVIDGSKENISQIKTSYIHWKYDLTCVNEFITKDNINRILTEAGFLGKIGLLSIDIDGNDYWVWEAITDVDPAIVICEYNSVFGKERSITVPYVENFNIYNAHYSSLYYGASLGALNFLAEKKGYALVGSNNAGNNVFFVKKELLGTLKQKEVHEAFVDSKFRTSRNEKGELSYVSGERRQELIRGMPVYNVLTNKMESY